MSTLAVALGAAAPSLRAQAPGDDTGARPAMPRYLLQGPGGRAVTSEDFRGRFQLIAFGYLSCPDVCPTTMVEMQQVLAQLGTRAQRLQPIFITVDPQRDTPVVLRAYLANFDPRILGLTGSEPLLRRAADAFNVSYARHQEPGAAADVYTVDHSTGMFLVDPDGRLVARFGYGTPVPDLVTRIGSWLDLAR